MSATAQTTAETVDRPAGMSLASAERRLAMLERMSVIGMALIEEVGVRNINAPYHPEPRHDPSRAFAVLSRGVRLCLVLEARAEAELVAIRNGESVPGCLAGRQSTTPLGWKLDGDPLTPAFAAVSKTTPVTVRAKVQGAVYEAIDREIGDVETARDALDRMHECLIEGEDYDAFLSLPWRDCIQAICADLGLDPDWSQWSDEDGFAPSESGPLHDWRSRWTYDADEAEARRRRKADRSAPPEPVMAPPGQGPP